MRRLHARGPFVVGASVPLEEGAARHVRVLRLSPGDRLELFDGEGSLATGHLVAPGPRVTIASVVQAPAPRPVVLIQALAKGDKLDTVIRMATEIGVSAIQLVETEHSVPHPDGRRAERWRRIAQEAARQSEQAWTPRIEGPSPLLEVASAAPPGARRLVLSARGAAPVASSSSHETWLVIGPEGGLSPAEEEALVGLGYAPWTLQTGILRTETAAAVALGALLAQASSDER